MLLLIDGYNLLHQSDLLGRSRAGEWLRQARQRLLRQLAKHLGPDLGAATCIVFDAEDPPPGRPNQLLFQSIDVRFAVDYPEADDLLEELIAQHPAPTRLTVVSSDHRVQRAILRRRGHCFDADRWYQRLISHGPVLGVPWPATAHDDAADAESEKPEDVGAAETARWLAAFGIAPEPPPEPQPESAPPQKPASAPEPPKQEPKAKRKAKAKPPQPPPRKRNPHRKLDAPADNPFPEGYGEDLL